jgi:hypothetical protein
MLQRNPRATVLGINNDDDEASTRSTHSEQRSKPGVAEKKNTVTWCRRRNKKRKPSRVPPRSPRPAHHPQVLSLSILPLTGHSLRTATISAPSALAQLLLPPRREESLPYPHRRHWASSEHCLRPRRAESRPYPHRRHRVACSPKPPHQDRGALNGGNVNT